VIRAGLLLGFLIFSVNPAWPLAIFLSIVTLVHFLITRPGRQETFGWVLLCVLSIFLVQNDPSRPPEEGRLEEELSKIALTLESPSFITTNQDLLLDWKARENEIYRLFQRQWLESGISYTLTDLNLNPLVWAGKSFSDSYQSLDESGLFWKFKDDRAILTRKTALPNYSDRSCYLIAELLVISSNPLDQPKPWHRRIFGQQEDRIHPQWISRQFPETRAYQPFFTLKAPQAEPDFILDALPVSIRWSPFAHGAWPQELAALAWVLTLYALLFACLMSRERQLLRILTALVFLILCIIPNPCGLDHLEVFSTALFGAMFFGNLFASPFQLGLSVILVFVVWRQLSTLSLKSVWGKWVQFVLDHLLILTIPGMAFFPLWVDHNSPIALAQPKEAFLGAGAFLIFNICILILILYGFLLQHTRKCNWLFLIFTSLAMVVFCAWFQLEVQIAGASFFFVWLFHQLNIFKSPQVAPWILRSIAAMLLAAGFFFPITIKGHRSVHRYIQQDWLQDMTLIEHENHNRIIRILDSFQSYRDVFKSVDNSYLAPWLAKTSGIDEDPVGFAILVLDEEGKTVSVIENQINIDNTPFGLIPKDRIEYYQETPISTKVLLFRKAFDLHGQYSELVIAITNSYQDLTSITRTSPLFKNEGLEVPFKHAEVHLKVFDLEGNPINEFADPLSISVENYERLQLEPFFSAKIGSATRYFYNSGSQLFLIQVSPLDARLLGARFVLFFGACWLGLSLLARGNQLKRRSLREQLTRSFRLRLAALFFVISLIPMALLMAVFLIRFNEDQQERLTRDMIERAYQVRDSFLKNFSIPQDLVEDISIFESGSLIDTTRPELFRSSTLSSRLPFHAYDQLMRGKVTYLIDPVITPLPLALKAVYIVAEGKVILGLTGYADTILFRENLKNQLEMAMALAFLVLMGITYLALSISKAFLQPIASITRAATRMQRAIPQDPIPALPHENEINHMIRSFNSMRETILWNEKNRQKQIDLMTITMETMKSGLLGFNPYGKAILRNRAFFQLFPNLVSDKVQEETSMALIFDQAPHDAPPVNLDREQIVASYPQLGPLLNSKETQSDTIHFKHDGLEYIILARSEVRDVAPDPFELQQVLLFEDITPQIESSKLKAWGEMARRIAHEIKNPLTPIQLEIEHLNALYADNHPLFERALEESTEEIKRQITQLHKTATDFGDYARPIQVEPTWFRLSELVDDCIRSYLKSKKPIKISKMIHEDPRMFLDRQLMRKALSNLLINSYEAMDEGTILVEITKIKLENQDPILQIILQDEGPGIPDSETSRIFEAYFSTKSRGTGLGLAIARRSIEMQGGTIALVQHEERGARFRITLPIRSESDIEPEAPDNQ